MIQWLKNLFGIQSDDATLPPFTTQLVNAEDVQEIIDWGLKSLGVPDIWRDTKGEGIKVAVLDTGIDLEHPDLKETIIESKDFTGKGNVEDGNGHGTHCAGIIASPINAQGIVGVAPKAQVMVGKVLSDSGSGNFNGIINGMNWALDAGADIISMSLGGSRGTSDLEKAVRRIIDAGKILIVAAGNSGKGEDTISYPGHYKDVICVGSINDDMDRSRFSSTGPNLTIMAPGENILSCYPPKRYARLSGTSMATPFIAGVAALILAKHRKSGGETPCENQKQMYEHLIKVAKDTEDPGWDPNTGWGIVDPAKSVNR